MISTVTTSTVSTVTTAALAGSVALIGIVFLFVMLVQKEITTASPDSKMKKFGKALNIAIIPLVIAFLLLSAVKVFEILN